MVYNYVCDEMLYKGYVWEKKIPESQESSEFYNEVKSDKLFDAPFWWSHYLHDCSIMRTCHEVHYEFAVVLYGRPL